MPELDPDRRLVPPAGGAPLASGELSPDHVVFLVKGMLRDCGDPWDEVLQATLRRAGVLALRVPYWADVRGVWFGTQSRGPAARIAAAVGELTRLHAAHGRPSPPRVEGIGFSHGGQVLLHAASLLPEGAAFDTLTLIHSSSFAWSPRARDLVQAGRVARVRNHCSWKDGVTLFAPLGAGTFGLRVRGRHTERIVNLRDDLFHWASLPRDRRFLPGLVEAVLARRPRPAGGPDPVFARAVDELLARWSEGRGPV